MAEDIRPGFVEGEAERIAYLFAAWRARRALEEAPEVLAHVRSLVVDTDGRTEPGDAGGAVTVWDENEGEVALAGMRIDSSPLRVSAVDASDQLFAELVNWVTYWAERLGLPAPAAAVAWSSMREVQGFRAGTTTAGAALLTRLQTMWLLTHHDAISADEYGPQYIADVTAAIWRLRARYPMRERGGRDQPSVSRPCPLCKGDTVDVHWFSEEDQERPVVLCSLCGWMPANERQTLRVLREVVS